MYKRHDCIVDAKFEKDYIGNIDYFIWKTSLA